MGSDVGNGRRLPIALATFAAWAFITVFSLRLMGDGGDRSLLDTVSHGISWNIVAAIVLLAIVTSVMKWKDLAFVRPSPPGVLRVLWFPALYLVLFAIFVAVLGLPPASAILFVLLNTMLVGLSEEFMFRGIIFRALLSRFRIWPAIIATSLMFGGVHVLNVFVTGQFGEAALQALTAACSGLVFMALLVRTGSLWVPIAYHALWDFGTFLTSAGADHGNAEPTGLVAVLVPLLLVLPNFLYGLFLLRKVRNV